MMAGTKAASKAGAEDERGMWVCGLERLPWKGQAEIGLWRKNK